MGPTVGDSDGLPVTGRTVGLALGSAEGLALIGRAVGLNVGSSVGPLEGCVDGAAVSTEGDSVGNVVGLALIGPCWLG